MQNKTVIKTQNFLAWFKRFSGKILSNFSLKRSGFWFCFLFSLFLPLLISQVSLSTPIASIQDINPGSTTELVNQAKNLYQNQEFGQAATLWQKTAEIFATQGDRVNQSMALSNLALTQQQLGQWEKSNQAIAESLNLLKNSPQTPDQQRIFAATLDIQAQGELATGATESAVKTWQQAIELNQEMSNPVGVMQSQINQSQAWQDLGQYPRACRVLFDALEITNSDCQISENQLQNLPNTSSLNLQVIALRSLGNVLRINGRTEESQQVLLKSFQLTEKNGNSQELGKIYLSLGNTALALGNKNNFNKANKNLNQEGKSVSCTTEITSEKNFPFYQQAAACYRQAAEIGNKLDSVQAQINLLDLLSQTQNWQKIPPLVAQIQTDLDSLAPSRQTLTSRLKFAQNLICLRFIGTMPSLQAKDLVFVSPVVQQCPAFSSNLQTDTILESEPFQIPPLSRNLPIVNSSSLSLSKIPSWDEINQSITLAFQQSQTLGDKRNEANALGYLGAIAQQRGDLTSAEQLTKQALQPISAYNFPDITYRWQWQLGRLYQSQGRTQEAIAVYGLAYQTLQSLRQDLVTTNPDIQYTFRDSVEPVYREFVGLLLQKENPNQENLKKARDVVESLQLAELNNFFREACLETTPQQVEQIDAQAAVIYGIVLGDRLAVILSLPNQPLEYYATAKASNSELGGEIMIEQTVDNLFATLSPYIASSDSLQPNRTLYDWLIRPAESKLTKNGIKTLVFVLDGALRGIPVAALHDGQQYLIEKYNVALTPGLQLFNANSMASANLNVLIGGLTEARQGFAALPGVKKEIEKVGNFASTKVLLDGNFTRDRLENQVQTQNFPIVHLATHGQFSSRIEDTFLITWDKKINVKNLDQLLKERGQISRNPIELLILSACQTAVGDKRAALGLAGVAVRSGAKSTLATLWSIQDQSTADFMSEFYQAINQPNISKAQALRQAQLSLLHSPQYQHPYYWAPFVLVGNWL
jgi:CHAT domain-containing protein/predicted Zn-dependent protease